MRTCGVTQISPHVLISTERPVGAVRQYVFHDEEH
jgi:hypothetical protein